MAKKQNSTRSQKQTSKSSPASKATLHEFPRRTKGAIEEPAAPMPAQHQAHPGIEADIEPRPRYWAPHYRGSGKLLDKVALITGGDSGIGRSVAVLYAREGADVAIVYLPEEQVDAEETREAIENEGRRAILIPGDVSKSEFCREAVDRTIDEFGQLDILVNNAAFQQHQKSIDELSEQQFEKTFRTNIFGYFYMAKAALPHMKAGSAIVNTGSITGLEGSKQLLDYSATKGAIHAFTKSLAQNLVEKKIRVNCVAPGPVWTPLNVADKEAEKVAEHGADVPMKRPAQPEEIAPAFVFLASEADSSYITGEVLTLLGGETAAA
ncbi:MAG TPA: SDR family oxidoreductase [Terriglobales bacterium]|jgi:NAD(P)-dependent dehydrogenase (short-subunit alcohol dehydrogenase family)|nr:SDR family oxidoreductase [Terriglobales bacterium]